MNAANAITTTASAGTARGWQSTKSRAIGIDARTSRANVRAVHASTSIGHPECAHFMIGPAVRAAPLSAADTPESLPGESGVTSAISRGM